MENLNNPHKSDDISIKELVIKTKEWFRYLSSRWVIILVFGVIGALIGFIVAYSTKPVYTATTTFVLEDGSGGGGMSQVAGLASIVGIDLGGGGTSGIFAGDNIIELYKSRTMIQKALLGKMKSSGKPQLLIDRFIEASNMRQKWADDRRLKSISFNDSSQFTVLHDSIISIIVKDINKNYLSVGKQDKKLSIITVNFKANDPLFAKAFVDEIVANVNTFYAETKTKKSLANIQILQHQTDSVKAVMNGAIFAAAVTLDATPNLNPTRQVLRAPSQRSQFSAEANKAILEELIKNLELSKMSLRRETPLIQIIDHPILPLEKDALGKVKGLVVGGILSVFLIIIFLSLGLIYKNVMSSEKV